ncbi:MAG: hypothetical protein EP344_15960 [Bacteroidetes bacterium]|nr:MAG: hypothetical protein EP344_15960 [Bacteroidota bacterium]
MSRRAEWLAQPGFFVRCQISDGWYFAELPVAADRVHGVLMHADRNAVYCTCGFYPKPCVHQEAFRHLLTRSDQTLFGETSTLPAWAEQLRTGRPVALTLPGSGSDQREAAQEKRHLERLERAANGFEDLEMWLSDLLRRGLATAVSEDPGFYQRIAGRLADASMRGLSRNFRQLESTPAGPATLAVLADAALALHAFRNRDHLPEALVHDLEAVIGIAVKKEAVRQQGEPQLDTWAVTGRVEEPVEHQLQLRRTWLFGASSRRYALLLEYVHGDMDFLPGFDPGAILDGTLIFYPSAFPQRVLVADTLQRRPKQVEKLPGYETLEAMTSAFADALGTQPWLSLFPAALQLVIPSWDKERLILVDTEGRYLEVYNELPDCWALFALSGGRPLTVFGEYDGDRFRFLSAIAGQRLVAF